MSHVTTSRVGVRAEKVSHVTASWHWGCFALRCFAFALLCLALFCVALLCFASLVFALLCFVTPLFLPCFALMLLCFGGGGKKVSHVTVSWVWGRRDKGVTCNGFSGLGEKGNGVKCNGGLH